MRTKKKKGLSKAEVLQKLGMSEKQVNEDIEGRLNATNEEFVEMSAGRKEVRARILAKMKSSDQIMDEASAILSKKKRTNAKRR